MSAEKTMGRDKALTIASSLVAVAFALGFVPRIAQSSTIRISLWVMTGICALLIFALRKRDLRTEIHLRRHHSVQFMMHSTIFVYWGFVVDEVFNQLWLYVAQIVLAYLFDLILGWWKRGRWLLGFGPIPVVGSINLFLWFKDDWWYLQIVMLLIAFCSKPFLRWKRAGRDTHIFNPSAIALAALSVGTILTQSTDITWGVTIARSLNAPTYMVETIFAVGVIVQLLFGTTLVTAGAALTTWTIGVIYYQATGWWFFNDTHIPIAVFLGMNLLITDPSTSPQSKMGRFLYGAAYGLAVFPLWSVLQAFGRPTFYDKLLQVPIMNLMVPLFQRMGATLEGILPSWSWAGDNRLHVLIWFIAFVALRPGLIDHPGKAVSHGYMLAHGVGGAAKDVRKAADLFDKSCYRGELMGCVHLAELALAGQGVARNSKRAIALFEKACAGGNRVGCNRLGVLFYEGREVARDLPRARDLYSKACTLKDANSCANIGLMYAGGDGGAVDRERGRTFFEKACQLGHGQACEALKTPNLGVSPSSQAKSPESACAAGDGAACGVLGRRYDEGHSGQKNSTMALEFFDKGCTLGHAASCNALGAKYAMGRGVTRDLNKAAQYAGKACNGGDYHACGNLGGMYLEGLGGPPNMTRARALFEKACKGGVQRACTFIQRMPPSPPTPAGRP